MARKNKEIKIPATGKPVFLHQEREVKADDDDQIGGKAIESHELYQGFYVDAAFAYSGRSIGRCFILGMVIGKILFKVTSQEDGYKGK